jgi:tripartite-type tricarboxylate transporter receptor subunit TctC
VSLNSADVEQAPKHSTGIHMNFVSKCIFVALSFSAAQVAAQEFPTRPIRLVVPYAPGGNVDVTARVIAPRLSEILGQSVIVDNRAGGGGSMGSTLVAKAPPDGYTLLMGASGPLSVNPLAIPSLSYDPIRDFAPISKVHIVPLVVLANPKTNLGSLKDLLGRAQAEPGKIAVASAGIGTMNHLAIELFNVMAGVNVLHVPYKGGGPALNDLLAGQVSAAFEQVNSSIGFVRTGQLTALAITGRKRSTALPNIPTLDELGLKGYEAVTFVGVLAPAGTPKPVIAKLNGAVRKAIETPAVLERLRELGTEPSASTPEEFGGLISSELKKWRDLAVKTNLKFE